MTPCDAYTKRLESHYAVVSERYDLFCWMVITIQCFNNDVFASVCVASVCVSKYI